MSGEDAGLKAIQKRVSATVAQYGWACISVHGDPVSGEPPFTYSVGFAKTFASPEIIILGMPPATAQQIINGVGSRMKRREIEIPREDRELSGVIETFNVQVRHLDPKTAGGVARIAQEQVYPLPLRAVHLVLPDRHGRFPGDKNCDEDFARLQDISAITL